MLFRGIGATNYPVPMSEVAVIPSEETSATPLTAESLSHLRHDLRTPFNQIVGYAEMLGEDAEDAGQDSIRALTADVLAARPCRAASPGSHWRRPESVASIAPSAKGKVSSLILTSAVSVSCGNGTSGRVLRPEVP